MTGNAKSRLAWVSGILLLALAVIVLAVAHGLRRWYSGLFFAIMGAVSLLNAMRWHRRVERQTRLGTAHARSGREERSVAA